MPYKITLDGECLGCGWCHSACPGTFSMENGKSKLKKNRKDKIEYIKLVASQCPASCIKIEKVLVANKCKCGKVEMMNTKVKNFECFKCSREATRKYSREYARKKAKAKQNEKRKVK